MTIKVALAGAGAFGIKHLDGIRNIDGVEVVSLISRELDKTREVAGNTASATSPPTWPTAWPCPKWTPSFCARPRRCMPSRRWPACAPASTCRWRSRWPTASRAPRKSSRLQKQTGLVAMCGHTRRFNPSHQYVHKQITGRQVQHPADGCADLFLPPHQHERARPGAQLDRPPAVAPRGPHRGPVRLPVQQPYREGQRHPGPDPPGAGHRDGHEHPAQGRQRRDLHAVA